MLSIAKINAAANQSASGGKGYLHYLGEPSNRQRTDFDDYARGGGHEGPPPFWACKGAAALGLDSIAEADQVERLARGFHPVTGTPLVKGAGDGHVMGLDMTFSAPKDFSAVFAGADTSTREALLEALHGSAKAALDYAEQAALTRHGHAGRIKQKAEAAIAACYTHFASRALDPQLHVHAFLLNAGKRIGSAEWSALEHRPQFERKLATGILFRVELAHRMRGLGFDVQASGPYFAIRGITDEQREALSKRSKEIAERLQAAGLDVGDAASREVATLNSRRAKSEPPLPELLARFTEQAAELGITPQAVASMRAAAPQARQSAIDHEEILAALMESQSIATTQEALCLICERAMGALSAAECLAELTRFMANEQVVHLGATEQLTEVFTSKATQQKEAQVDAVVAGGAQDRSHRTSPKAVGAEFDRLEADLRRKLGVPVSLEQQRAAALHVACETGRHAFVEGWAGTGKTTMLRALASAYKASGFEVFGCCQSAAATRNLARETGIPSRTLASLLFAMREGKAQIGPKTILVLDEAGMVGSSDFALLQSEAMKVGAKLVAVGDPKQLQPIAAGGMFASLMRLHGRAEISNIQRQRTDFLPLHDWLEERARKPGSALTLAQARALRDVPEDRRIEAMEAVCSKDAKLARAFAMWRARFDHEWMRGVVESFAKAEAAVALRELDARKRLRFAVGLEPALNDLISEWEADKTPPERKAIVAGTRAEVRELNERARQRLVKVGHVRDDLGCDIEIIDREENRETKRFAPGDRIVFTQNDRQLGVVNGATGRIHSVDASAFEPRLVVMLDDANERDETLVAIPASFGHFDLAYCLTNHKAQGRTFDSTYVLANPAMSDREWTYVAASRSRFATTLYVNAAALGLADPESHVRRGPRANRNQAIEALAKRMARSRAKGTSLDYEKAGERPEGAAQDRDAAWSMSDALAAFRLRLGLVRKQERTRT
jgi:conjugative relaxase-like TrwC/TraI family protein